MNRWNRAVIVMIVLDIIVEKQSQLLLHATAMESPKRPRYNRHKQEKTG